MHRGREEKVSVDEIYIKLLGWVLVNAQIMSVYSFIYFLQTSIEYYWFPLSNFLDCL